MRAVILLLLGSCCPLAMSYSIYDAKKWSQKSVVASSLSAKVSMVQRDTIRMPSQTPMVPYKAPGSDYTQFIDIEAAMYRDRTMMIRGYIDEQAANNIISILLYLRNESPRDPISIYFNVPGGMLRPCLAIYDLLLQTKLRCNIETVNLALCAGMGAMLCSAGTKGQRASMPNARFLLQRIGMDQVFQGQARDVALEVRNVKLWNERLEKELSDLTGQDLERIQKDLKRDFYLSSDEAVQYGLIDRVYLPAPRKRSLTEQEADLGSFEGGKDQKFQGKDNKGGWGSKPQSGPNGNRNDNRNDDDDNEPKIAKG